MTLFLGAACVPTTNAVPPESVASANASAFDHARWTLTLERFVDESGFVDYEALAADRAGLDAYLAQIASSGPQSTPQLFSDDAQRLAYYLNAYNALVFDGVLARGPEKTSVWTGGLISGYAFFAKQKFTIDGAKMSLKKLEDAIVRKEFGDPRIHAALNCASIGCPRLPRVAFHGATLEQELDRQIRFFVSESRNVRVDTERREIHLSQIFDWFKGDFLDWEQRHGSKDPALIDYLNRYRGAAAALPGDYKIVFTDYDKRLNRQ